MSGVNQDVNLIQDCNYYHKILQDNLLSGTGERFFLHMDSGNNTNFVYGSGPDFRVNNIIRCQGQYRTCP